MTPPGKRKIGLQLPETERFVRWNELRAMALLAEQLSFDSIWIGDHLIYRTPGETPRGPWEAWSVLAGLAEATSEIELGPLVACTAFHNPAIIAKKAATVDEISNGRLILGLGAGWNQPDFDAFGFPYDHRVARFEEAFTIIRTLLATGEIDFHGKYYDLDRCLLIPNGPRQGNLPLLIGSVGERVLKATLPYVDAWNVWFADYGNTPAGLREVVRKVDGVCESVGRDPATLSHSAAVLVSVLDGGGRTSAYEESQPYEAITGSPESIAESINAIFVAGVDHVQIVIDPITIPAIEFLAPVVTLLKQSD